MKAYVVYCHPLRDSLVSAARDRALAGLSKHEVRVTDLYAEGFCPELSAWERTHHLDPPETKPAITVYAANLRWCDTLVFVYPTWWSGQPGMLKGWIDRVMVAGVAYELPPDANRIRPLLHNIRRLVVVTSHGSSKWINALQGEGGKRVVSRALRVLCSRRARTTWIALYGIDRRTDSDRSRFLDRVERKLRSLH